MPEVGIAHAAGKQWGIGCAEQPESDWLGHGGAFNFPPLTSVLCVPYYAQCTYQTPMQHYWKIVRVLTVQAEVLALLSTSYCWLLY